jgi:hypothetical protein
MLNNYSSKTTKHCFLAVTVQCSVYLLQSLFDVTADRSVAVDKGFEDESVPEIK